jgi:hypothetical protein
MSRASIAVIALLMVTTDPAATVAFGQRVKKDARAVKSSIVETPHFSSDRSVKLDYDLVYVRAPRRGDEVGTNWAEVSSPLFMDAGADLMLLHPNGTEEMLVAGGKGSVTDPMVSFDGEWVYYALFHDLEGATVTDAPRSGADVYKIHVRTRQIVRLTHQQFTPNTGAGDWSKDFRKPEPGKNFIDYGVFNTGPCPLPGGKVVFTSNRNAFRPPKRLTQTLQLFVMDDDGSNVACIGHLNLGTALHPVVLMDGRIIFSSLESQGLRTSTLWGLWSIHPDGSNWGPVLSAFLPGESPNAFHFQTQLSDGSIVAEEYYNQTSSGFGGFVKLPVPDPTGGPAFGPGHLTDRRNPPLRGGTLEEGQPRTRRLPFSPRGVEALTPFARTDEGPADFAILGDRFGPRVGKVTHPSAAPDNHLLTVWSPGPVNGGYTVHVPAVDSGLYLLKAGKPINEPAKLLLIKNDPLYNEQWPRALVPYQQIYGITEPKLVRRSANDGRLSPSLPEGTPFGLVGTSSLYKRESYPNGGVPAGGVTASFAGGTDRTGGFQDLDPFNSSEGAVSLNWTNQGADAGRYANDDIHAIRILVMEPTTDRQRGPKSGRTFRSHANERLRILGEIPVRKFRRASTATADQKEKAQGGQPIDPDGNPDTSFLARIPADVAFTFQTLDKYGMVLNMAQTWHQLRPGEVRDDCGGCHAHSQKPTLFRHTAAARPDYRIFDLTESTPLVTTKPNDQSDRRWDREGLAGLRYEKGVKNVEYYRDVKPILDRSCIACHTQKSEQAAGDLVLDDNKTVDLPDADDVPGTYYRLATDYAGRFGRPPLIGSWRNANASRYIRMFQSRRSLLIWKVFGRRTDGWTNDDFPTETVAGDPHTLHQRGKAVQNTRANRNRADLDFTGSIMPPPAAVAGAYLGPDGKKIRVTGLSDEDRLTLVRWIDLGCPIDLDFNPNRADASGFGWMLDDQRPTLTLTSPHAGENSPLTRVLIGMYDYGGLALDSVQVVASFPIVGIAAGENLAKRLRSISLGIWELKIERPISLASGKLTVSVKDRQGNETRIERTFTAVSREAR